MTQNFEKLKLEDGTYDLSWVLGYHRFLLKLYDEPGGEEILNEYFDEMVTDYYNRQNWKLPTEDQMRYRHPIRRLLVFHFGPDVMKFDQFKQYR